MGDQRILLIDSDQQRGKEIQAVLQFLEYQVVLTHFSNYGEVLGELSSFCKVMISSSGEKLAKVVKTLKGQLETLPIVLITDKGVTPQIPSALDELIFSIQEWPTTYPNLTAKFKQLQEKRRDNRRSVELFRSLGGNSRPIQNIRDLVRQVAPTEAIVLILGESGTGKEVVARNLHYYSLRRDKPFVPVNCGAIPSELLESELFGHEKGAFTGALSTRQGRFEMAEGGTLFLDEIGDMPLAMQVKLLRVLQERTFERVGSNRTRVCDVRIIAATHRNLEEEISQNRFREDLYYRLNVFPVEVPALRERVEDLPILVGDLISRIENEKRGSVRFTPGALQMLQLHTWPGNVRELANLVERLAILNPHGVVDVDNLPEKFKHNSLSLVSESKNAKLTDSAETVGLNELNAEPIPSLPREGMDLKEHLIHLERDLIRQALDECNGVVARAAKLLKMRRTTLVEKMRKHDIQRCDDATII